MERIVKLFLFAAAAALGLSATVPAAPADARQGCGPRAHRGPGGYCQPDRGPRGYRVAPRGPRYAAGRYYPGRGYWHRERFYRQRYRYGGGWRYR